MTTAELLVLPPDGTSVLGASAEAVGEGDAVIEVGEPTPAGGSGGYTSIPLSSTGRGRVRVTVQLDDGEVLAIKFDNVLQLVDAEVTGTSRDEYNGKSCRVTGFDAEQLRYTCDLGGGKVLGLALDKVILPAGARARVVGLTSASGSKWNDHIGKVVEYDRVAGRYLLQLGGGNQLHIKPANARL